MSRDAASAPEPTPAATRPVGAGSAAPMQVLTGARIALSAVVFVLAVAPLFIGTFTVSLLNDIGIGALVALGLVLLTGVAGAVDSPVSRLTCRSPRRPRRRARSGTSAASAPGSAG